MGTDGIQKRELGRERSSNNKSNILFMSEMFVFFLFNLLILFYLSIKFGSFVYFFFSLCLFLLYSSVVLLLFQ